MRFAYIFIAGITIIMGVALLPVVSKSIESAQINISQTSSPINLQLVKGLDFVPFVFIIGTVLVALVQLYHAFKPNEYGDDVSSESKPKDYSTNLSVSRYDPKSKVKKMPDVAVKEEISHSFKENDFTKTKYD